ncbi:ferritin-like domain-containing protein [Streptomyces sp. SID3343]|uniref:ferritin-like domain-containing protein n=1 Tax=Streptomyces sp. SID3343 TaxID=2690260 RepID=UPI00136BBED7|nr:ferritin-like domain-containing protein [Streptomyces sp. SID3343]MYW01859.1 ferritin-like domain-containing protein [Streptomyces sp. SID3343]
MLSARGILQEIHRNDEAFRLFCSIAAKGENQGGWENGRIAALVADPELAPKIARHGADEDKHGRIFNAMLHRRGLDPVDVPPEADYCMLLERQGIGLAHDRLRRDEPMTEADIVEYLVHSRVTEQRAAEDMRMLHRCLGDEPDVGRGLRMICDDEENHLAYCHEELLRLSARGDEAGIGRALRKVARAEIKVNRDVSLAVMERMGRLLDWSRGRRLTLKAGIHAVYAYDRLWGTRRMVRLRPPKRVDALGPKPAAPHRAA